MPTAVSIPLNNTESTRALPPAGRPTDLNQRQPTTVETYPLVSDGDLSSQRFPAGQRQRGRAAPTGPDRPVVRPPSLTEEQIKGIRLDQQKLKASLGDLERTKGRIEDQYSELDKLGVRPPSGVLGKAWTFLTTWFGLRDQQAKLNQEISSSVQHLRKEISKQVSYPSSKTPGATETTSIEAMQRHLKALHQGKTFKLKHDTPEVLKAVSVPSDKEHRSFKDLKTNIDSLLAQAGSSCRITRPTPDRIIIFRQVDNGKWESLELSWRSETQVSFLLSPKPNREIANVGSLYNIDAEGLARRFISHENLGLKKRRDPPDNTVWKVIGSAK